MDAPRYARSAEEEYLARDISDEMRENKRARDAAMRSEARRLDGMRREAERRMGMRTVYGRRYEEHRCGMAPHGWRLRRYSLPNNPYDRDIIAPFVWVLVRTEPPDDWLDGYECSATLNGARDEPRFCPWCGAPLDRMPDALRGWTPWL